MTSLLSVLAADVTLVAALVIWPHAGAVVSLRLRRLAQVPADGAAVGLPGAAHRSAGALPPGVRGGAQGRAR